MTDPANPFSSPEPQDSSSLSDSAAPPAKPRYFLAWLCFFLVATIGGFVIGAAFGGVLGGALAAQGAPMEQIVLYSQIAGFVLSLPVSYLSFRWAVATLIVKKLVP